MRLLALAAVGLLGSLAVSTAADAAYTTGNVNLRTGPSTWASVITTVPPGAYVRVFDCGADWCRVRFQGVVGWMSANYIARGGPGYVRPPVMYPPHPPYYVRPPWMYPRRHY